MSELTEAAESENGMERDLVTIDPLYGRGEIFSNAVLVGDFDIEKADLLNRLLVFDPLETILQFFPELHAAEGLLTIGKKDLIERARAMGLIYEDWLARIFYDVLIEDAATREKARKGFIPEQLEMLRRVIQRNKELERERAEKKQAQKGTK